MHAGSQITAESSPQRTCKHMLEHQVGRVQDGATGDSKQNNDVAKLKRVAGCSSTVDDLRGG